MTYPSILTEAQEGVLQMVCQFRRDRGYPPTRREVADAMGFKSANAAEEHLQALERKGRIRLHRGIARGLEIL